MSAVKKKSTKSPKNHISDSLKDINKYKELMLKEKKYDWSQFIEFNKLSRSQIILSDDKSLVEYYFKDKQFYYQDLSNNAENISLNMVKFILSKSLTDDDTIIKQNIENNSNFDYNVILSFIEHKRSQILEYLYDSFVLPENFYISGIYTILYTAINISDLETIRILLKYLPKYVKNLNYLDLIDSYHLGQMATYYVYKLILTQIKSMDSEWHDELMRGISDSQIDQDQKNAFRI